MNENILRIILLVSTTGIGYLITAYLFKRSIMMNIVRAFVAFGLCVWASSFVNMKFGQQNAIWSNPLMIASGALIIYILKRRIANPFNDLKTEIDKLATGNLKTHFSEHILKQQNELGEISNSLKILTQNLSQSVAIAGMVSRGTLYSAVLASENLKTKGDLDIAIENMIREISKIVSEINDGSETITTGANEISSNSQNVSQAASQQATSIEEISSSMEQMLSSINQNAENANQTKIFAKQAAEDMKNTGNAIKLTIEAMREIATKILIVNEIANKTEMLAINAAIEAARAGESGKGFAVVAGEVRKLAESSRRAALQIDELSQTITKEAENSGSLVENVLPGIKKTSELVEEISSSSLEQRSGIEQIANAINQLNYVTQSNAASAEELAASSELFIQQAQNLRKNISFFKLNQSQEVNSNTDLINKIKALLFENGENISQEMMHTLFKPKEENTIKKNDFQPKINLNTGAVIQMNDDKDDEFEKMI